MTTKATLLDAFPFIQTSYDLTPKLPSDYDLLGMIQADPTVTARLLTAQSSIHLPFFRRVLTPDPDPWGSFAYNSKLKHLEIGTRGTKTELEWLEDFLARLIQYAGGGSAHEGMLNVFEVIAPSFRDLTNKIPQETLTIRVQGHSLGCSLASFGCDLLPQSKPISPVLWAPPRTFNPAAAVAWNMRYLAALSVRNIFDIVPRVPLSPPFANHGIDIEIHGDGLLNPKLAHNLTTGYLPGVNRL